MSSFFETQAILRMSEPLMEFSRRIEPLFPQMEWNLKKAGYSIDTSQYISVVTYVTLAAFMAAAMIITGLYFMAPKTIGVYTGLLLAITTALIVMTYQLAIPKAMIIRRSASIDRNLEYMLKDIQIQLSSGVPLFDTLVNISRGEYNECSKIASGIIQEVEQGKSITDVLEDVGMWSPSEYLRKTLWQIVNAIKSGSDVVDALNAIANDIRMDKENKIKSYGKELNLWGLVYMMGGIVIPSMGVTLLVILSSFMGKATINERLFYSILFAITVFHVLFITFVKSKRPQV